MKVRINGEEREVDEEVTIAALLDQLGFGTTGVAVAIDRQVVPRGQHTERKLHPGAEVELIRAGGGG